MSSGTIELEPLKPSNIKNDEMIRHFEQIVNTYKANYFNMGDLPLLEIFVRTYNELLTLYGALELTGSVASEKNKQYEKISRLIDSKVNQLIKLGASLRINPQQRKAAPTNRDELPTKDGRSIKSSGRDAVTDGDIWD